MGASGDMQKKCRGGRGGAPRRSARGGGWLLGLSPLPVAMVLGVLAPEGATGGAPDAAPVTTGEPLLLMSLPMLSGVAVRCAFAAGVHSVPSTAASPPPWPLQLARHAVAGTAENALDGDACERMHPAAMLALELATSWWWPLVWGRGAGSLSASKPQMVGSGAGQLSSGHSHTKPVSSPLPRPWHSSPSRYQPAARAGRGRRGGGGLTWGDKAALTNHHISR